MLSYLMPHCNMLTYLFGARLEHTLLLRDCMMCWSMLTYWMARCNMLNCMMLRWEIAMCLPICSHRLDPQNRQHID